MSDYLGHGVNADRASEGMIAADTPCRKCGYNLRGLQHDGRCPECSTPAGVSVFGDLLRYSHPEWLEQVSGGTVMLLWGILVSVVGAITGTVASQEEREVAQFIIVAGASIGAWGSWRMTMADPSGIGETGGISSQKLLRGAVVAALVGSVADWLITAGKIPLGSVMGMVVFQVVCGSVKLVGECAKLQYIERLANRIPDEAISARANTIKHGLALCYGMLIGVSSIMSAVTVVMSSGTAGASARGTRAIVTSLTCVLLPVAGVLAIMGIMAMIVTYQMRQAVKRQIPLARETWSRAEAAVRQGATDSRAG